MEEESAERELTPAENGALAFLCARVGEQWGAGALGIPPAVAVAEDGEILARTAFPIEPGSEAITDTELAKNLAVGLEGKIEREASVLGFARFDREPPEIATIQIDTGQVVRVRPTSEPGDAEVTWEKGDFYGLDDGEDPE